MRSRFITWADSGYELMDGNHARFHACIMADHDSLIDVNAVVEVLEEEGEALDSSDHDELAWVWLVSRDEGSRRVRVSSLLPRCFDFVPYNWEQIADNEHDPERP